jgi:hypothetical protein
MPIQSITANGGQGVALLHYGSIAELEADAMRTPMKRAGNERLRQNYLTGVDTGSGPRWYGLDGGPEAVLKAMAEGYSDGAARVDAMYDAIAPSLPKAIDYRRKMTRADQGDELDIHAVYRGDLEHAWTRIARRPQLGTGVIRIAVDVCANANVNAESMAWRGVAALALSRAMKRAGYSVEIIAGLATRGVQAMKNPARLELITCVVKARHAAPDPATLAASVALPGFFRVAGFCGLVKAADLEGATADSGLGHCIRLETVLPVPERVAQVVCGEQINHKGAAEKWVKEQVALLQMSTLTRERRAA